MRVNKLTIGTVAFGLVACATLALADDGNDNGNNGKFQVIPRVFDPFHTNLVFSGWLSGTGCPTNATTNTGNPGGSAHYTDPACLTGDTNDKSNEGLFLVKTGPTPNDAAAVADITNFKTQKVTELGYDIRKPGLATDPRGSHCGAGAPRFNVTTSDGKGYFIGCNSPTATTFVMGTGWLRLRWGGTTPLMGFNASTFVLEAITSPVKSIQIVFDEGQDTGPDNFGAAVLDNIDINGVLVGQGPNGQNNDGGNGNHGNGEKNDN